MVITAKNSVESFLDNDLARVATGLTIAILGSWAFAEIFRAWAYADHWAEPLVIAFCFLVLAWSPIVGFGLIFGYQKDVDPAAAEIAAKLSQDLQASGWSMEKEGNTMTMKAPDGRVAIVEVTVKKENANG